MSFTDIDIHNREVIRVPDYFSVIANGEETGDILRWSFYLDRE